MELDVHLTRECDEPWGLEFIGGRDQGTPLTISQVYPSSPAHTAGLQPGDTVTRIGDHRGSDLTLKQTCMLLADAVGALGIGVCRGLYDPVLDDFEAIYEPTERADSDLPSEPTEVSPPRYVEFPEHPISDLDFRPITDSRSLTASPNLQKPFRTASPFLPHLTSKPYRPFSTEPIKVPVPPVEDPIILNPSFKDDFAELLEGIDVDMVETKFKLPVSEQYDPNYKKKVDGILEKSMERELHGLQMNEKETVKEVKFQEVTDSFCEVKERSDEEVIVKGDGELNETAFDEKMKSDIDMERIEKTAIDVVEESIERAVSVTEEIKEAIEEELRESATREIVDEKVAEEKKTVEEKLKLESSSIVLEKEKDEIAKQSSEVVIECIIEKQERKSKEASKIGMRSENAEIIPEEPKEMLYVRENRQKKKDHEVKTEKSEFVRQDFEVTQETKKEETKKEESKQKAYSIGLQTIPNIRGMVNSSYHFDLLMRTFFIHLTDVMVAMSRFILTQPATELESKAEKIFKDNLIVGLRSNESVQQNTEREYRLEQTKKQSRTDVEVKHENQNVEIDKSMMMMKQREQEYIKESKHEILTQEHVDMELEEIERKRISGVEMSQRTQRKPKDLTNRMEAVITEFETKTGIDEERRSRSRSQIEEEVMRESDPIEWLDKVNKQSQEKTTRTSSHTESRESRKSEHEVTEVTHKTKPGKQMYVAVVESHVYTNEDAILQESLETSSVESTEEIKAASVLKKQAVEVISQAIEESNVTALAETSVTSIESKNECLDVKECMAEKKEISQEIYKTGTLETSDISLEMTKDFSEKVVTKQEATEAKQDMFTSVASESTEVNEELEAKSFKATEVFEKKAEITSEENYKTAVVQTTETLLEESKDEVTQLKVNEKHASSKIEQHAIAIAESTDIVIDDSKVETFQARELNAKTATTRSEETFKTAATETAELALEEAIEDHMFKLPTRHVTIRETTDLPVAGIIDTKIEEDKVPKPTENEYAALKIIKQELIDSQSVDVTEINESNLYKKSIEIENIEVSQETTVNLEKLHLRTDIAQQVTLNHTTSEENTDIDTPTPSTIPPTPLTDEYVFKLEIPLPKHSGPIIREESTDHEDLNIVKKRLIPHIETTIDETIIYDPPLSTPTEDKEPVFNKLGLNGGGMRYTRPGLRGGASVPSCRKEYIREIERKSSLLASAIDQTIRCIEEYKEEAGIDNEPEIIEEEVEEAKPEDELVGYKSVAFEPENSPRIAPPNVPVMPVVPTLQPYLNESGEPLGSVQGIVDGLQDSNVNQEVAKELGKPGLTEDKIAELISGESEMLREAHVMGLSRVLSTHMNKPDDSSVDFNKIKPINPSLKNSEVIAALNAEILKSKEKKKDDKKWTTFLQKPQRPPPRAKCGYWGYLPQKESEEGPYKVKIVKQPKPKIAPDYKPEDFETGPLPWESRALSEPPPPPVEPEEPILIPEESPEFVEAVDPLPESEVPDLQDTGIILPPPKPDSPEAPPDIEAPEEEPEVTEEKEGEEEVKEEKEMKGEVEEMAEQLVQNVKSMVDPNAPIQQQLAQMRAQLAALAQLPCVIQQSLEMLTNHLASITTQQETREVCEEQSVEKFEEVDLRVSENDNREQTQENSDEVGHVTIEEIGSPEVTEETIQDVVPEAKITLTAEEFAALQKEEEMLLQEQIRAEKLKKVQEKIEQESRQLKQRAAPRVGKPKMFGPQNPEVRPLVLPGGRRWKGPKDVFNDQFIAETLQAQSEVLQGKVMGFESDRLPYDERINFMKYEKPPVNLDHLQNSEVYKAVHGMDVPMRRVDLLTPVVCEADYRERCRSMTPSGRVEEHLDLPQQLQP